MPIRALRIPADPEETIQVVLLADYDDMAESVGGYIEFVQAFELELMINEEGKLQGLPPNARGTALWWAGCPAARERDVLCGPVVVMGPVDDEGESTGLDDSQLAMLADLLS